MRTGCIRVGKLAVGAATSGAAKSLVGTIATKVVMEESLVKIGDLDPSYWAYWLSTAGYNGQAGERKEIPSVHEHARTSLCRTTASMSISVSKAGRWMGPSMFLHAWHERMGAVSKC
jgi:hypothetical protein